MGSQSPKNLFTNFTIPQMFHISLPRRRTLWILTASLSMFTCLSIYCSIHVVSYSDIARWSKKNTENGSTVSTAPCIACLQHHHPVVRKRKREKSKTSDANTPKVLDFSERAIVPSVEERELLAKNLSYTVDGENILKMKPVEFLPGYKNPCWYDVIGNTSAYLESPYLLRAVARHFLIQTARQSQQMKSEGKTTKLRCLPYFYLIGQPKCGTTTLYYQVTSHPDVIPMITKEPHWWTRYRLGIAKRWPDAVGLHHYTDLLDVSAGTIHNFTRIGADGLNPYHPIITGDGSASTMWHNDMWWMLPENRNLSEPRYLVPHYIHHLQPSARIISMLRNPTERLYSDYLYLAQPKNKSPEGFHACVVRAVYVYRACARTYSMRACAYSRRVRFLTETRLHIGLYSIYLSDWLSVFPRDQILVLRLEEYSLDPTATLTRVFDFLRLRRIDDTKMARIASLPVLNSRRTSSPDMLNKTRMLLNDFYAPYNTELSRILGDKAYLWQSDIS